MTTVNKQVEIELTGRCNASCPGCARVHLKEKGIPFPQKSLDTTTLFHRFSKINLTNLQIKLCGVLGDPLLHPQIATVIRWFIDRGSFVQISTNASLQSEQFWSTLGEWSARSLRLYLSFAVDGVGETNAIYRVNTDFEKIVANMQSYSRAKGIGQWVFIEFDHNSHQKEEARKMAKSFNLDFSVRRSTRNVNGYGKIKAQKSPHPKAHIYKKIVEGQIKQWNPRSIYCKFVHGKEFFLACDGTVWPCCYLWDEYLRRTSFFSRFKEEFSLGKNSIYQNDFSTIFQQDFYTSLPELWEAQGGKSDKFSKRCYISCGEKGSLTNKLSSN